MIEADRFQKFLIVHSTFYASPGM